MPKDSRVTLSIILIIIILAVGWSVWKKPAGERGLWHLGAGTADKGGDGSDASLSASGGSNLNDTSDQGINADLGNVDAVLGGLDNDFSKSAPGSDEQSVAQGDADLAKVIANADLAISARITALTTLGERASMMKYASDSEKAALSAEANSEIASLNQLKAKIDAETDADTAASDAGTLSTDYKIYTLVVPKGYVMLSADRASGIVGLLTNIEAKLKARINASESAGNDAASLNGTLADLTAKLNDANSQAQAAEAAVAGLSPDNGGSSVADANSAALLSGREHIQAAIADLKAARDDAGSILAGLKEAKVPLNANSSATLTQ
ncbi:MAG TPA: hypothetical protein VG694_00890 [Candidatus Paceibacterota bacterium]|jgi:hypothetical protein|nr:hypothetical protein [Candidatus Paceibacterota bacterium]